MLLCRFHLRGLAGRSRRVHAIKVDEWAGAHESDPRNRYRRPHHYRPADQVRRERAECRYPVGLGAEPWPNADGRAAGRGCDDEPNAADAAVAGPDLSNLLMK